MSQDVKRIRVFHLSELLCPRGLLVADESPMPDHNSELLPVTEHDRIVAELRAEVEKAQSIALDRKRKVREHELAIDSYKDRFEQQEETIARQAKVIEIATQTMATVLELEHCGETSCPRPTRAMCSNESHKVLRSALKELEAIDKEGAE